MIATNLTHLLITAGGTVEPLDDVRFIGNRSSGQLGCLLAQTAAAQSYEVTLLLGPNTVNPPCHPRLNTIPFSSTRDLSAKLKELWPSHALLIMAAAVADFTPKGGHTNGKIRRGNSLTIEMAPTDDIVADLASTKRTDQRIIGFALEEPDELHTAAISKLQRKKLDAIVANPLVTMESQTITATVFCKDGRELSPHPQLQKSHFAKWLIEHLNEILSTT
jgi:phosphopantothenoylcysteine decarboxylase / phosphopantothenate---cysteine ligase